MKTIAFYSFKGGVGRTSALLNVAYLLAAQEQANVVVADWDVHAPGLTCLYELQAPDGPRLRAGVIDLLTALVDAAPGEEMIDPAALVHPTRVGCRIAEAGEGDLWLVPAGAFDPAEDGSSYLAAVQGLTPKIQELAQAGRADLVAWFAARVAAGFTERTGKPLDYLLLDARTGLTEVGELLLSEATTQVVVLFGLNAQNQLGMEQTLRRLTQSFGPANVASRVVLVASPVPAGEEALKARQLGAARSTIARVVDELTRKASAGDANPIVPMPPRLLTIPYHPLLALDEELIAEHYPESDPGRAYVQIKEAVQIHGAGDIEAAKATLVSAVGRTRQERSVPMEAIPGGEHPLARLLRWNVVSPDATEDRLAPSAGRLALPFLKGLTNLMNASEEQKAQILDIQSQLTGAQMETLVRSWEEDQRRLRELAPNAWPLVADWAGQRWAEWALLSGRRLGIEPTEAARRLLDDWPSRPYGETGTRAAFAAIDVLVKRRKISPEALRRFLARVTDANPAFDFALGAAAVVLIETVTGEDAARILLEKAAALPASNAAFNLALRAQNTAERLLPQRVQDALLLFEQACIHYSRTLAIKPDMREAEHGWGLVLARHADAIAGQDLERAVQLWEQAVRHFERALAIKPDEPEAEYNWGLALARHADAVGRQDVERALRLCEEAHRHYERALAIKPNDYGTLDNLIALESSRYHLLYRSGREAEARTIAERALDFARRHEATTGRPSYNLACALSITGHHDEALDMLGALHNAGTLGVDAKRLATDPDFAHLAMHPRFVALVDALRAQAQAG